MGLFQKATKSKAKLRLALVGPSGSGKTWSALSIASGLAPGGRIAVIDTEHGSASKYADQFDFDSVELANFDPRNYISMIEAAVAEGYDVVIVDSLSHAWMGKGGALEMVDQAAKRSRSGNSFTAWKDVTPIHNKLIEAILGCGCHLIATMRSKVEFVIENDASTGRSMPKRVGTAPIQREGMDYEFDVQGDIDHDHNLIVVKSRCPELAGAVIAKPGAALGRTLAAWLSDGAEVARARPMGIDAATVAHIEGLIGQLGMSRDQVGQALAKRGASSVRQLSPASASELIGRLDVKVEEARKASAEVDEHAKNMEVLGEMLDAGHAEMAGQGKAIVEPTFLFAIGRPDQNGEFTKGFDYGPNPLLTEVLSVGGSAGDVVVSLSTDGKVIPIRIWEEATNRWASVPESDPSDPIIPAATKPPRKSKQQPASAGA